MCLLGIASPAAGHDRQGRAQPSIETTLGGSGLSRTIGFRVRDSDSGNPIPEATLSVRADDGGGSSVTGEVTSVQPELFRVKVDFPRPGNWSVHVDIGGDRVAPASFSFDVPIDRGVDDRSSSGGLGVGTLVAISLAGLAAAALAVALVERRRRRRA